MVRLHLGIENPPTTPSYLWIALVHLPVCLPFRLPGSATARKCSQGTDKRNCGGPSIWFGRCFPHGSSLSRRRLDRQHELQRRRHKTDAPRRHASPPSFLAAILAPLIALVSMRGWQASDVPGTMINGHQSHFHGIVVVKSSSP